MLKMVGKTEEIHTSYDFMLLFPPVSVYKKVCMLINVLFEIIVYLLLVFQKLGLLLQVMNYWGEVV